ncbi:MAG TPA: L,D-transpeptidase family protein, partial [Gemmatimonadales bacterium]|nr:L,D-transpeptidase family protein [Gemmatimonadales bacterium]
NALGVAKFIFPNDSSVYLHDTPRKDLFAEEERDFSHGCISVEDPLALAEWVLRETEGWKAKEIEAAMAGRPTRRAVLREPIPVLVFYTTAVAHADGSVWFYPDVYGHDRELVEALQGSPARVTSR